MFDVNLIEDNDFMDKDVTQLNDDYYLFHLNNDKVYFFHCGLVFVGKAIEDDVYGNWIQYESYIEGTLSQYIEKLEEIHSEK